MAFHTISESNDAFSFVETSSGVQLIHSSNSLMSLVFTLSIICIFLITLQSKAIGLPIAQSFVVSKTVRVTHFHLDAKDLKLQNCSLGGVVSKGKTIAASYKRFEVRSIRNTRGVLSSIWV